MFNKRLNVLMLILLLVLVGCNESEQGSEKILSSEETVEEYFKYWVAKDNEMMNSFVTDGKKDVIYELDRMTSLTLDNVSAGDDRCNWNDAWYDNPYEHTCLNVTFTVKYKDGHGAGFSNGTYKWQYYLVKASEDSDWLIVMWGVG